MITYPFEFDHSGTLTQPELVSFLGGKGANLHRMTAELGLPVPEGFTIPCQYTFGWQSEGNTNPLKAAIRQAVIESMGELNAKTGRMFGDSDNPLLVSVRSGAPKSMPGMMETILNLGLNDETVIGLAKQTNDRFAWDSYRRFIQMFAVTALEMDPTPFTDHIEAAKKFHGTSNLPLETIQLLVQRFKTIVHRAGKEVPQDVYLQLFAAIVAVFKSWSAEKARTYRQIEGIDDTIGTAVNIQRMVFGNMNEQSGTGVAFTRDPNTGAPIHFGDFLINAQGEDVVDGSSVTMPLESMESVFPEQFKELTGYMDTLEKTFKDMCDIEFTIEDGKLFMLQTRVGKRNPKAAIRIALDMMQEGLINTEEATDRIYNHMGNVQTISDDVFSGTLAATGLGASPGKVSAGVVFTPEDAIAATEPVILVRTETSPNDVGGMSVAKGILTAKGGLVSHAAVVARGWGKPCVVGCSQLAILAGDQKAVIGGHEIKKGDQICIDGETGEVFV